MAIPGELAPDVINPTQLDSIISSSYDVPYAQQLAHYGLPIRPALGADRSRRKDLLDYILSQQNDVNAQKYDLSRRQLESDMYSDQATLAGNVAGALDPANEAAIGRLGPVQDITDSPEELDRILYGGSQVIRDKTLAEGNKAQAEAEGEPIRAKAALIAAQNEGSSSSPNFELEYNAQGDLIGFKQKGKGTVDPSNISGEPTPTTDIYDQGNNAEIPSATGSGDRLIMNSDGSGTMITSDGRRVTVSKEDIAAARARNGY